MCEPMKPVPPVTSALAIVLLSRPLPVQPIQNAILTMPGQKKKRPHRSEDAFCVQKNPPCRVTRRFEPAFAGRSPNRGLHLGSGLSCCPRTRSPLRWVLAQNWVRHHAHSRSPSVIPRRRGPVKDKVHRRQAKRIKRQSSPRPLSTPATPAGTPAAVARGGCLSAHGRFPPLHVVLSVERGEGVRLFSTAFQSRGAVEVAENMGLPGVRFWACVTHVTFTLHFLHVHTPIRGINGPKSAKPPV